MSICFEHKQAMFPGEECSECAAAWEARPDPSAMTQEERAAEIYEMAGRPTVTLERIRQRISALLGRDVSPDEVPFLGDLWEEAKAVKASS